jgi:L-ascorbate metabolism protein UlaG (beta-lactamase superfamily)
MKASTQPTSPADDGKSGGESDKKSGALFDGRRFKNPNATVLPGWKDVLRWQATRKPPEWPGFINIKPGSPPPRQVDSGSLRLTFINHATLLIQLDGRNILTDPIWSERASPASFFGPRRHVPPGIRFDDLPPLDVVLLSHNHYDHLDLPTLRKIRIAHEPVVCAGRKMAALIGKSGIKTVAELDWWQTVSNGPLRIHFVPAQHWSARGLTDRCRSLWGGFVLEGPSGVVYFAGDTGFGPHFESIRDCFPDMRAAILPIGAHEPRWFMKTQHMSPEDAIAAHRILRPVVSVGMHFGTFQLADDGFEEAPRRLVEAYERTTDILPPFWLLAPGEGRQVPHRILHSRSEKE